MSFADRDDAKEMHVLIKNDNRVRHLHDLLRIRRKRLARMAVRQTQRRRIIVPQIAGRSLEKLRLRARQERSHLATIEIRDAGRIRVGRSHDVSKRRPSPNTGKIRLAIRHARHSGDRRTGLSCDCTRRSDEKYDNASHPVTYCFLPVPGAASVGFNA